MHPITLGYALFTLPWLALHINIVTIFNIINIKKHPIKIHGDQKCISTVTITWVRCLLLLKRSNKMHAGVET